MFNGIGHGSSNARAAGTGLPTPPDASTPEPGAGVPGADPRIPLFAADALWDRVGTGARDRGETAPAVNEVLTWCDANLGSMFPAADEAEVAARAIKVMALASLLPGRPAISPREMTDILGASSAAPAAAAEVHVVAGVMRRMQSRCPGILRQRPAGVAELDEGFLIGDPLDGSAGLEEEALRLAGDLATRPVDLTRAILELCDDPRLPLARLAREPHARHTVRWQGTERNGFVMLAGPGAGSPSAARDLAATLGSTEADYLVVVMTPELAPDSRVPPPGGPASPARFTPADAGFVADPGHPVVVWYPHPLPDAGFWALAAARRRLAARHSARPGATVRNVSIALSSGLDADRIRAVELLCASYARGRVEGPAGLLDLSCGAGTEAFDAWLERVVTAILEHRFPRHFLISPGRVRISTGSVCGLVEKFLRAGGTGPGAPLPYPVLQLVDGFLSPAGLAARRGRGWALDVDPARSDAARFVLEATGNGPVATEELYWRLRKGPLGLSRPCFDVLLVTLIFSGHLVALNRSRPLPLVGVTAERLDRVTQVARERPLEPRMATALLGLRFLFVRKGGAVAGGLLPRPLWNDILALRTTNALRLAQLRAAVSRARAEPAFATLGLGEAESWLQRIGDVLSALDIWGDPHSGLTRLYRLMSEAELLEPLDRVRRLLVFLEQSGAGFLSIHGYLGQQDLDIPCEPRFGPLSLELARLRDRVRQGETCLSRDELVRFEREVHVFRENFRAIYTADHAARAACARLEPSRLDSWAACVCGHQLGDAPRDADVPVRDLAVLSRILAGRVVSRRQVFDAVTEWLGGAGDDETLVRVLGGSRRDPGAEPKRLDPLVRELESDAR